MMQTENDRPVSRMTRWLTAAAAASLAVVLARGLWELPPYPDRLQRLVSENMAFSGVENQVTAVLLNFRGYDTLLEIGVLLLALVGVLSAGPFSAPSSTLAPRPILMLLLRRLLPFIILFSGYILWIGKYAPGGAFQAGALLAGGGILYVAATDRRIGLANRIMMSVTAAGLLVFLLVALATLIVRGQFLAYPAASAGTLILVIETAATLSIGAILILLFVGAEPVESLPDNSRQALSQNAEKKGPK